MTAQKWNDVLLDVQAEAERRRKCFKQRIQELQEQRRESCLVAQSENSGAIERFLRENFADVQTAEELAQKIREFVEHPNIKTLLQSFGVDERVQEAALTRAEMLASAVLGFLKDREATAEWLYRTQVIAEHRLQAVMKKKTANVEQVLEAAERKYAADAAVAKYERIAQWLCLMYGTYGFLQLGQILLVKQEELSEEQAQALAELAQSLPPGTFPGQEWVIAKLIAKVKAARGRRKSPSMGKIDRFVQKIMEARGNWEKITIVIGAYADTFTLNEWQMAINAIERTNNMLPPGQGLMPGTIPKIVKAIKSMASAYAS